MFTESHAALGLLIAAVGAFAWLRWSRARAIERVLYAEVYPLRWQAAALAAEIARRHQASEPYDAHFFDQWVLSGPLIYPSTGAADLSRLPRAVLANVGHFHAQLADARRRLEKARLEGGFQTSPYRVLVGLVRAYYVVDPWIKMSRPRFGAMPPGEPDLALASRLLDELEQAENEPISVPYCWVDCVYPARPDNLIKTVTPVYHAERT